MRLHKNAKIELLKSVPLFSHCTKKELDAIAAEADELFLPEGSELTRQGGHGREFMVIVDGSADVKKNGRLINVLDSGDFLGEIALISEGARTATITAETDLRTYGMTFWDFRPLVEENAGIAWKLLQSLAKRLRAAEQRDV